MERKVNKKDFLSLARKKWRSNHVDDEMLQKIRDVLIESRLVETMIFKKMVIAIGAGVIKANEPKKIEEIWMRSGIHSRLSSKSFTGYGLNAKERDNWKSGILYKIFKGRKTLIWMSNL